MLLITDWQSLIVMVASLNIIGTLILVVVTRRREISIFRAMGTTSMQICSIFMLEGLIIGLVGTIVGTVLGLAGCYGLREYEWPLDTDVYFLDTLPVVVDFGTIGVVGGKLVVGQALQDQGGQGHIQKLAGG